MNLNSCPFCGGKAEFERIGTPRQSCIVKCRNCGCHHEGPDENERSGEAWNRRAPLPEEKATSPNGLWMVYFEDKARPPEVFFGEGAEGCARLRYKQAYDHWSCHLLSRVPTHPLPEAELYLPSPQKTTGC